MQQSRFHLYYE